MGVSLAGVAGAGGGLSQDKDRVVIGIGPQNAKQLGQSESKGSAYSSKKSARA